MRTRAAVAVAPGKPLEIMEVNLEGPKPGEVLVEIELCGNPCHAVNRDDMMHSRPRHLRPI